MISKRLNNTTLNIGGSKRDIKFNLNALELYMSEVEKDKESILKSPFKKIKLMLFCGLQVGEKDKLPEGFNMDVLSDWIDDCTDERFDEVCDFAREALGFITSEEEKTFTHNLEQAKRMGIDLTKKIEESISL